jgi:UDP-glucose:(heptosyl)LPS alpha-1,3-glucosyltransferase
MRRRLGVAETTTLLLIVAHNFTLKGVPTLLNALKKLTTDGKQVHLAVVGGKRLKRWRQTARRIGVDSGVTFIGTAKDTVPYYAAADVYVHPTFYDPCSLVLLEAAASGLPIVTTKRCNGVSELLRNEADAFLVEDPTDARGVAERIEILMDDSPRRAMGEAARQMALRHTFDRNVGEMLAVYSEAHRCRHAA